ASFRTEAIRDAVCLNISYLPIYAFFYCIYCNARLWRDYKSTIVFSVIVQFMFTLPYISFYTLMSFILPEEGIPTTVLWCTVIKRGTSTLNFMSYGALIVHHESFFFEKNNTDLEAIGITRVLNIVIGIKCGLKATMFFFMISSSFGVYVFVITLFNKKTALGSVCYPLLFFEDSQQQSLHSGRAPPHCAP
ncbi:hypothetical protein PMAYCL1PPCAC_14025, partial [Pristionchus mayeri]